MTFKYTLSAIITLCFITFNSLFAQNETTRDSIINLGKINILKDNQLIPIKIWNDLILIDAEVNGIKGTFIWDNGFTISGLDEDFAKKIGIKPIKNDDVIALDGNNTDVTLSQSIASKFVIAGVEIDKTPVTFIDITKIVSTKNEHIIGIIGASIINKLNWKFDFDNNTVTLSNKMFKDSGIKLKILIDSFNNAHYIPFQLNGEDIDAVIDFGFNDDNFSVTKQLGYIFSNNKAAVVIGSTSISVSGISRVDTSWIISKDYTYTIDNQKINYLPRIFLTDNESGFRIGNRFFRRYNCDINMQDSTYILMPRNKPIDSVIRKSYGIKILLKDGKMFVGQLISNPNVEGKKIQLEEEVLTINGKKASDFGGLIDLIDYQKYLLKNKQPMKVKMVDKQIFTFTPLDNLEL